MRMTALRLRRLLALDVRVFEEARRDTSATVPSLIVAAVAMAALGVGGWLWWTISGLTQRGDLFLRSVVLGTVFSLALWLAWLLIVYAVLLRVSGVRIRVDELVRAAGLATAPLVLGLAMAIPGLAFGVGLTAIAAWVATTQIAIERVSGVSGGPAAVANIAGFGAWALVMSLLTTAENRMGPGPFVAEAIWELVTVASGGGVFP